MAFGISGNKNVSNNGSAAAFVEQSQALLYQGSSISMATNTQAETSNQIRNPNGLPLSNLYFDIAVTDTTGSTSAPSGVNAIDTALTQFTIFGASGNQLMNIQPNVGDPFKHLQHRLNSSGYYNTAPTPADSSTSTAYEVHYNVVLGNWTIFQNQFPLSIQYTVNTQSSRATTLNSMTSTVQLSVYGAFVKNAPLPPTRINVKPVTGIAASNFYFDTYLDQTPIYDLSVDVGSADSNIASGSSAINFTENGNSLIPNTSYQNIINAEDQLYNITTPHITGFFPLNVLSGMRGRVINPATAADSLQVNFSSQPNVGSTSGKANLYMIEKL